MKKQQSSDQAPQDFKLKVAPENLELQFLRQYFKEKQNLD